MSAVMRRVLRFSVVLSTVIESVSAPGRIVIPLVLLQLLWAAAPVDLPALHGVTITTALLLIGALTWLGMRAVRALAAAVLAASTGERRRQPRSAQRSRPRPTSFRAR